MHLIRAICFAIASLSAFPIVAHSQTADPSRTMAVVDIQKVLTTSIAGIAARNALQHEKAAMQQVVDARRREIDALRDEVGRTTAKEDQDAKQARLAEQESLARQLNEDFQNELARKERAFIQQCLKDIQSLVERIGEQRRYFVIFEKRGLEALRRQGSKPQGILYAYGNNPYRTLRALLLEEDLTTELINLYDAQTEQRK